MEKRLLQMRGISKRFAVVQALDHVDFDLKEGEIHALTGENGAGKSTLMKILGGVYAPDEGDVFLGGERRELRSAKESIDAGIGVIYQEYNLVPTLSVAENIFLGQELTKGKYRLDREAMFDKADAFIKEVGFEIDSRLLVRSLSVAQEQMVEILKALFHKTKILVMDEPTSVLTQRESEKLFGIMLRLKKAGVGIVYISHRLEEILRLSDRITILRDGKLVATLDNSTRQVAEERLVSLMVGRRLENYYPMRSGVVDAPVVLEVKDLSNDANYRDVSFSVHRGEIVGITGLVGAGRTEVVKSIFGAMAYTKGSVYLDGTLQRKFSPREAIAKGIAFLPENRKEEGLFLDGSIGDNVLMANYEKVSRVGIIENKRREAFVREHFSTLNVRPNDPEVKARDLSGGNQQKAIIAKWLAIVPKIIILDEPTRGVDIGAKVEIYHIMDELAARGCAILMVSSEMPEVMGMSDAIIVLCEGQVTGRFKRIDGFSQEAIMAASSGLKRGGEE
jgi:ribose transport system ATP-binding protein